MESPERRTFVVGPEEAGARLDLFLARRMSDWSRSQLQRLIGSGKVQVDSRRARKAGEKLDAGATVSLVVERETRAARPENLPLTIVYEDLDLAVIEKPAGMVVHAGAGVRSGTLVNALLHHFAELSEAGGAMRPGIVHRLDKMASGLMVVAKNDFAHRHLAEQFKTRQVRKTYQAFVHGLLKPDSGQISKRVGRDPARRIRMKAGGIAPREAVTEYRVTRHFAGFSLLEAMPRTGRTHQLRVHFAALGHPIVGDTLYGAPRKIRKLSGEGRTLGRLFLHATQIEFQHPRTGVILRFESPLPAELRDFLEPLEKGEKA